MNLWRFRAMAVKEAIQIKRDKRSLTLAFVLPMGLILFFGYAITFDVDDLSLGVFDQDHSMASRELVATFESSGYFEAVRHFESHREIDNRTRSRRRHRRLGHWIQHFRKPDQQTAPYSCCWMVVMQTRRRSPVVLRKR